MLFFLFFEIVLLLYFAYITVIGNYTTTLESIVMRKWRIPIIFLLFFVNFGNSQFVRAETIDSEVIAEKQWCKVHQNLRIQLRIIPL